MIGLGFRVSTERFLDRQIAASLGPVKRRFFKRAGGSIRQTARRLLRHAPQTPYASLTSAQRHAYDRRVAEYKAGKTATKPRRPDQIAQRGRPPMLHERPQSMLKSRLFFSLNDDANGVVIGPEQTSRQGNLQRLEATHPFMEPAYETIEPRLPGYLRQASGN